MVTNYKEFFINNKHLFDNLFLDCVIELITKKYGISLVFLNDISIKRKGEDNACGLYLYLEDDEIKELKCGRVFSHTKYPNFSKKLKVEEYPYIFITKEKPHIMAFLALHELGHHIIRLNNLKQSEALADAYTYVLIKELLDPIFSFVYNIDSSVFSNIRIDSNTIDWEKVYFEHYKPFCLKNNIF